MRAVWYEENGDASVLQVGEMPDPQPGPGEVRVRVVTSGVNPSDWKRRQGTTARIDHPRVIPNQDGGGIIDMVGDGVPASRIGERVWLYQSQFGRAFGTAAEYTVQPSSRAIRMPDNVDFALAAGLGVPALTAHRCVFADGPLDGKTVLVPGGAGAVGNMALQMARLGGAERIISTVSGDAKAEIARQAGAQHTVNYRTEDTAARILEITNGEGVDLIVEVDYSGNFAGQSADHQARRQHRDLRGRGRAGPAVRVPGQQRQRPARAGVRHVRRCQERGCRGHQPLAGLRGTGRHGRTALPAGGHRRSARSGESGHRWQGGHRRQRGQLIVGTSPTGSTAEILPSGFRTGRVVPPWPAPGQP